MKLETAKFVKIGRFSSRGAWIHPARRGTSYELIIVTRGFVWIEEAGRAFDLREGDVLLLEPEKEHRGYRVSCDPVSFYWVHFEDFSPHLIEKVGRPKDLYSIVQLCRQMLRCAALGYDAGVMHALLHVLLGELSMQIGVGEGEHSSLALRVREWVRINADRPLTVRDVSEQFGYHVDYLSRLFCKSFGHGLKAEIAERRLHEIKKLLLESNATLAEIADRTCGDYKLFLKFFRYHEGITPSEYRQLYTRMHTNNR